MVLRVDNETRRILSGAKLVGTHVKFDPMPNRDYDRIKYLMEYIGGHWREKDKAFVFKIPHSEIKEQMEYLLKLNDVNIDADTAFAIKAQYYPTPDWLAEYMIALADIKSTDKVLEPSAGRGRLLNYISKYTQDIVCIEPNEVNALSLEEQGYTPLRLKFEEYYKNVPKASFDKIVMNPPFSKEMDLRHIALAYNLLKPGGTLISLAAENSLYYDRSLTRQFNEKISKLDHKIQNIPTGAFAESGTNVDVVMIIIHKHDNSRINFEAFSIDYIRM